MTQPAKNENPIRLWGGRFTGEMDPLMNQYNESLSLDRVFYAQDIKGSIAYARANVKTGILTQEEFEKLEEGLKKVLKEWDEGKFQPAPGDEGEQAPGTHAICTSALLVLIQMPLKWRLDISNQ
jgi:argininosuccinate lyase